MVRAVININVEIGVSSENVTVAMSDSNLMIAVDRADLLTISPHVPTSDSSRFFHSENFCDQKHLLCCFVGSSWE